MIVMRFVERFILPLQQILVALVFLILVIFTYAYFFKIPYAGFDFSNGYVFNVPSRLPRSDLQIGDELIRVGEIWWADFAEDATQSLLADVERGETVPLLIRRGEEILSISWTIPGFSQEAFLERLYSGWWLPYVFWIAGAVTYLFIRPRDIRWHLLIAFNLLTALWLSVGSGPSHWHIWYSSLLLKATIWLCVPVYWHFHWLFPKPLGRLPMKLIGMIYALGGGLAILELFQLLPVNLHLLGFLLAIGGSLVLLIAHAILQSEQRESLGFLLRVATLVILPVIAVSLVSLLGGDFRFVSLVLLGLPLIPAAYIYAIYRDHLGKLELRANRVIILYLYFIVLCSVTVILAAFFTELFSLPGPSILLVLLTTIVIGLVTVIGFPTFERFVERRILGVSLPPESLLETYTTQIVTKLDKAGLVQLLKDQVLPSLLVRQSAVIYWGQSRVPRVLFTMGAEKEDLPTAVEIPVLLEQAGIYRPLSPEQKEHQLCPWVRLSLPLKVGDKPTGLWLLGRRDPDDMYLQREIPTLQALAAQTAIALTNILQAENLHRLYQANIDRHERERTHLALELHDDILNQMALLVIYVDEESVAPQIFEVFERLTTRVRQTIRGLRPAMLNYGLGAALDDLADQLTERVADKVDLQFAVASGNVRYPANVEQHIFRIVQQAVENSLQHAEAKQLRISGYLRAEEINLVVEDDGIGFLAGEQLDLSALLRNQHFGLAGMYERAALIGAEVKLDSTVREGTCVSISWQANEQEKLE